jgi:hypothetical protein
LKREISFLRLARFYRVFLPLVLFTALGFLVMGYHPGAEDDSLYLAAVKARVNPVLFPRDAAFFQLQMRTSIFDNLMARFVAGTGIPVAWAELLGQWICLFLVVWSCWSIVRRLFNESAAHWAGVAMVAAMLTLPVAGTGLYPMDQYLHPRNPATALLLLAVSRILAGKRWQAVPLAILAFLLHPLMGALGISFCSVLALTLCEPLRARLCILWGRLGPGGTAPVAAFIPFAWIFGKPSAPWLEAERTRHMYFLYQWEWYEWLGALGPVVLFWLVARRARRRGETNLCLFATAILIYGVFQQAVAMVILSPAAPIGMTTLEPMRYLQLVYIFLALIGGAYLGRYVLKARVWRWAVFLLVANGGMFLAQRQLFAASPHIELPNMATANPWLQAFDWIRRNTPEDAYFALDPNYTNAPGEDCHGFRALAERGMMADSNKDTSTVTKQPTLGPAWKRQVMAREGWSSFQLADFERLKAEFGADWALLAYPQPAGLDCRWHNGMLAVCRIP